MSSYRVSIGKYQEFEDILNKIGGLQKFVKRSDTVFIKPNICAPRSYETGTVTNPYLIEKLIILLKDITPNIKIGDGPIPVFGKLSPVAHPILFDIAKKYALEIIDLNHCEKGLVKSFVIAKPILEADVIINMPVLKTHSNVGVTLSLKNMMGVLPLRLKHEMHKCGLDRMIVELAKTIKPHLNIVDATFCQEGEGPTNGTPVKLNLVIAGDNQVAVDSLCCKVIGLNPRSILHIRLAEKEKLGSLGDIETVGFRPEFLHKFKLPFLYRNIILRLIRQMGEGPIIKFFEKNNEILIENNRCIKCRLCTQACPVDALSMTNGGYLILDKKRCILCLCCQEACLNDAIKIKKKGITSSGIIR